MLLVSLFHFRKLSIFVLGVQRYASWVKCVLCVILSKERKEETKMVNELALI